VTDGPRQPDGADAQTERARRYARVFGGPDGRAILDELEAESFVDRTTMSRPAPAAPLDPLLMAYNEGLRAAVLRIRARVRRGQTPKPAKRRATSASAPAPTEESAS
jgi:hypothetical protein